MTSSYLNTLQQVPDVVIGDQLVDGFLTGRRNEYLFSKLDMEGIADVGFGYCIPSHPPVLGIRISSI